MIMNEFLLSHVLYEKRYINSCASDSICPLHWNPLLPLFDCLLAIIMTTLCILQAYFNIW